MPRIALLAIVLLLGCASAAVRGQPDERSPDFLVPAGSRLELHRPLEVPAWQDQVYFQDGQTMSWRGVNIYIPYCTLKLSNKKDAVRWIQPDTFDVRKSYTELFFQQVRAPMRREGIQPAAAWGPATQIGFEPREAMDYKVVAAVLELHSASHPEVTRMMCADWGLPQESPHITVAKMRRALGSSMTLLLAQPPAKQQ